MALSPKVSVRGPVWWSEKAGAEAMGRGVLVVREQGWGAWL